MDDREWFDEPLEVVTITGDSAEEQIAQMYELGWFDVEFTMYGCAYLYQDKMLHWIVFQCLTLILKL